MNWQELLVGVALVLVVEGLIPFASPGRYRKLVEVISNIEFLKEVGDVEMVGKDESQVRWTGSENYAQAIEVL